jgi:hypothetical protein
MALVYGIICNHDFNKEIDKQCIQLHSNRQLSIVFLNLIRASLMAA